MSSCSAVVTRIMTVPPLHMVIPPPPLLPCVKGGGALDLA